jgi:ornithine carbamoyltransferase
MTEKLTLSARAAIFDGQQEARARGSAQVEPEHLLLGLLSQTDSVAYYVLARLSIDCDGLRERIDSALASERAASAEVDMSESSSKVITHAEQAVAKLHDLFLGTEHLLIALSQVSSLASEYLADAGADTHTINKEIAHLQNAPEPSVITDEFTPGDSPIHRVAQQIIQEGMQENAEAIYIEPTEDGVRVGLLAHGLVSEAMTVPKHIVVPLLSRFRSMMNMQAPEKSTAAGTIRASYRDEIYDLLVSFDSVELGDRLAMRILRCPALEPIPEVTVPAASIYSTVPSQRMAPPVGPSPIGDVLNTHALRGRDIIGIEQLTVNEIMLILDVAARLKANKFDATQTQFAQGQTLAMLFEKPSLRTRVTFEAGMTQLGGHAIYLEGRLGLRETVPDVAKNLDRWIDGIMARTFDHKTVTDLAENAKIPVINGLSDREHPCQALADFQTIGERKGRLRGLKLAYVGDVNNVAHSLMLMAAKLGTHFSIGCPSGYEPDPRLWKVGQECAAQTGATLVMTGDPTEAVAGADAVYTDVWASMGQEEEAAERAKIFAPFQLNAALMAFAKPDAIVMHCLPAHRGEEITGDVLDGPQSVVFDQAENRLHAQKAVLALVL